MTRCYHCLEDIPAGTEVAAELGGVARVFCCHACLGVAELIESHDLGAYYQARNRSGGRPVAPFDAQQWQAYDIPEVAAQYVHREDEHNVIYLYIDGIHCAACAWLIREALERAQLAEEVRVNTTTARAEIRYRDGQLSAILAAIARLGYQPNLFTPQSNERRDHRERNRYLLRLIVAGLGTMQVMMFASGLYTGQYLGIEAEYARLLRWISLIGATPVLLYSGWPFLKAAVLGLRARHITMDLPIALATVSAYVASVYHTLLGRGEIYFDSVTMFIFFLSVSRFLEFLTRRRARLNDIRFAKLLPDAVEVLRSGQSTLLALNAVRPGDRVLVRASRTIPVDGHIVEGQTRVDEAMLSGESTAQFKTLGAAVLAGSTNLESPITIEVSKTGQETTLAGIRRLIAHAEQHQSPIIDRNERLARATIAAVLLLAGLAYLAWHWIAPERAFGIAIAVLVATCPCALSLATPTALTSALNRANALGILIKDSSTVARLTTIRDLVFDKTGTLTQGQVSLVFEHFWAEDARRLWGIAKALEQNSNHPIAWYFVQRDVEAVAISEVESQSGAGVLASVQGQRWFIGSAALVARLGLAVPELGQELAGIRVFLGNEAGVQAVFVFADALRPELATTIAALQGFQLHIASGDKSENVRRVAQSLGIADARGDLSPAAKLAFLKSLPGPALMIGDGINDAPVLAGAAVSVAVGRANPLSQTHADIVLMNHGPEALPFLFALAERTETVIRQNLFWAVAYNAIALPLAAFGVLLPWMAALGMSASSLLVVVNALRVTRTPAP